MAVSDVDWAEFLELERSDRCAAWLRYLESITRDILVVINHRMGPLRRRMTPDDLAGKVMIESTRLLDQLEYAEGDGPRRWVMKIAVNVIRQEKTRAMVRRVEQRFSDGPIEDSPGGDPDWTAKSIYRVSRTVLRSEEYRELAAHLARLPDSQRSVVVAVFFEGCSPEEAAEREGISVAAVRKRIQRMREGLRKFWKKEADRT